MNQNVTRTSKTVLLVEDDPALALGLCDALQFEGLRVLHANTGKDALICAEQHNIDCVILDLMLPDLNGYQICASIREHNPVVPIIMLTARSQESDKIRGLDAGADDYMTKPFSVGELVARIRALFRRVSRSKVAPENPFHVGGMLVDPVSQTIQRGQERLELSFYEVELLRLLHDRTGQPVSRDEILDKIWGVRASTSHRTIDNFIVKLRKKIEEQPDRPQHILTVYGIGYKLVI